MGTRWANTYFEQLKDTDHTLAFICFFWVAEYQTISIGDLLN
jgi:hypothetical protein